MKCTERRPRSDSAKAAVQANQNAALGPHKPPKYVTLRDQDKPYWTAIMQSRPRHTWNENDLVTAATMARAQSDIEMLQRQVDAEGYFIDGKTHEAAKMIDVLSKRVITLSRLLHVHAEATLGRAADSAKTAQLQSQVQTDDDDLIPRIRMVG